MGKIVSSRKKSQNTELEQRYVIKCFTDEDLPAIEMILRLRDHYGKSELSRTQIYFWNGEVKQGKTDLNNNANSGRGPDEDFASAIAVKLDAYPHLLARKLAQSLGIAALTICPKPWEGSAVTSVGCRIH
jgi:hypothetical protein